MTGRLPVWRMFSAQEVGWFMQTLQTGEARSPQYATNQRRGQTAREWLRLLRVLSIPLIILTLLIGLFIVTQTPDSMTVKVLRHAPPKHQVVNGVLKNLAPPPPPVTIFTRTIASAQAAGDIQQQLEAAPLVTGTFSCPSQSGLQAYDTYIFTFRHWGAQVGAATIDAMGCEFVMYSGVAQLAHARCCLSDDSFWPSLARQTGAPLPEGRSIGG